MSVSVHSEKDLRAQEDYYIRKGIYNLKFSDVSKCLKKFEADAGKLDRLAWLIASILAAQYVIDVGSDLWVVVNAFLLPNGGNTAKIFGGVYLAFVVLSLLCIAWSGRDARKIVLSDDISDTYTNNDAKRWFTFKFDHWLMFAKIDAKFKPWDKIAMFIYLTLKEWYLLILVALPKFLIVVVNWEISCDNVQSCTELTAECAQANSKCATPFSLYFKVLLLGMQLSCLLLAVIFYPIMRCIGMKATRSTVAFRTYCSMKADGVISNLLVGTLKELDPEIMAKLEEEMVRKKKELAASGRIVNLQVDQFVDDLMATGTTPHALDLDNSKVGDPDIELQLLNSSTAPLSPSTELEAPNSPSLLAVSRDPSSELEALHSPLPLSRTTEEVPSNSATAEGSTPSSNTEEPVEKGFVEKKIGFFEQQSTTSPPQPQLLHVPLLSTNTMATSTPSPSLSAQEQNTELLNLPALALTATSTPSPSLSARELELESNMATESNSTSPEGSFLEPISIATARSSKEPVENKENGLYQKDSQSMPAVACAGSLTGDFSSLLTPPESRMARETEI